MNRRKEFDRGFSAADRSHDPHVLLVADDQFEPSRTIS
jgi:hypothetical protein